jgi:hypothetical protein
MAALSSESDVVFYNLIHQLVGAPPKDCAGEQRQGQRQAFLAKQWIAPGYTHEPPPESAWIEVRCHDLTGGGFSFFLAEPPTFERLLVAFGRPPSLVHVTARVTHCKDVLLYPSGLIEQREGRAAHVRYQAPDGQEGKPMVLVGCKFLRKLGRG